MLGLAKTCMKLKLSFYEFLVIALASPAPRSRTSPNLSVPPRHNDMQG